MHKVDSSMDFFYISKITYVNFVSCLFIDFDMMPPGRMLVLGIDDLLTCLSRSIHISALID